MANKTRKGNRKKDKTPSEARSLSVSLRISPQMERRLERYEKHLRELRPNVRITRAGLVMALIERGLVAFEQDERDDTGGREPRPLVHR